MSFLKNYLNKLLENHTNKLVLENSKQYKVNTHFERDRAYVSVEDLNGKEIITWWDDDVRELIDDGFLNPKNFEKSAIEYARYLGLIENDDSIPKRKKVLKDHIEETKEKMRTMNKESTLFKDSAAQIKRWTEELKQYTSVTESEDTKPLWVLYVGKKGSGTLHPQFSDYSRKDVVDEYNNSWKNDHDENGNKIKYSYKIIKVNAGDTQPKSLTESTNIIEARERKTEDEYSLYGNYGHGWELLTTASTFTEIRANRKDYRENEPGIPLKVVKKRVKKGQ